MRMIKKRRKKRVVRMRREIMVSSKRREEKGKKIFLYALRFEWILKYLKGLFFSFDFVSIHTLMPIEKLLKVRKQEINNDKKL
jgi:hypothetical protein